MDKIITAGSGELIRFEKLALKEIAKRSTHQQCASTKVCCSSTTTTITFWLFFLFSTFHFLFAYCITSAASAKLNCAWPKEGLTYISISDRIRYHDFNCVKLAQSFFIMQSCDSEFFVHHSVSIFFANEFFFFWLWIVCDCWPNHSNRTGTKFSWETFTSISPC